MQQLQIFFYFFKKFSSPSISQICHCLSGHLYLPALLVWLFFHISLWKMMDLLSRSFSYDFMTSGPSGKIMLLPEEDPNATHIMIATGTGVAPFRGYLRRMFMEDVPNYRFGGLAWLFLGVANSDSLLYDEEFTSYLKQYPDNFRLE